MIHTNNNDPLLQTIPLKDHIELDRRTIIRTLKGPLSLCYKKSFCYPALVHDKKSLQTMKENLGLNKMSRLVCRTPDQII